jgi:CPA1 family monovalent cation:H+ antiporter
VRDLILFLTFGVIFVTLVLQGLTLKAVIRALRLQPDAEDDAEETEARHRVKMAGLARLDKLKPKEKLAREILAGMREKHQHLSHRYEARARGELHEKDENRDEAYRRFRLAMIDAERKELLNLRDRNVISDAVMRRIQKDLDLEQILLESTEAGPAELEDEDSARAKA